jgi:hypothetical protein
VIGSAAAAPARALGIGLCAALAAACPAGSNTPGGDKDVGAEGGPCTSGGGCDPGLSCKSDLCVDLGEGEGEGDEGEGEACAGDQAAQHGYDDCADLPAAAASCGAPADNATLTTCQDAALILRTGVFNDVYPCLDDIDASTCSNADQLNAALGACFSALNVCSNTAVTNLCQQAFDACDGEGQPDFPKAQCQDDLVATNQDFREAYAQCFNDAAEEPCVSVHDFCYNFALATLVDAHG